MGRLPTEPASLQPYRSSAEVGWDGLYAAAYHVPRESESMQIPAIPELTLIVYRGGPLSFPDTFSQDKRLSAWRAWQSGPLRPKTVRSKKSGRAFPCSRRVLTQR